MRFKLDENMPTEIAKFLRSQGHDAMTVFEERLDGQPDPVIAEVIRSEQRVLAALYSRCYQIPVH